ncbi:hypothetical protein [Streptomyces sp. AC154]|uniref:hypothetical protein n=1 Tax=Streptomyces sp. AC154 TaxID=3143184 RepID=UPI003F7ED62E
MGTESEQSAPGRERASRLCRSRNTDSDRQAPTASADAANSPAAARKPLDGPAPVGHDRGMFRYAFLAARSAVADAPKAAVSPVTAAVTAALTAAAAPIGGARS